MRGDKKLLPGEMDTRFGIDGIATLSKEGGIFNGVKRGVTDDKGRILLAANLQFVTNDLKPDGPQHYAVVRLDMDGRQDSTFGTQGIASGLFTNTNSYSSSVTLTHDNKVVLSGTFARPQYMNAIGRFDEDGVLDPSFGRGGVMSISIGRPKGAEPLTPRAFNDESNEYIACVISSLPEKNKLLYTCMGPTQIAESLLPAYSVLGRLSENGSEDPPFPKEGHNYIKYPIGTPTSITWVEDHLLIDEAYILVTGHVIIDGSARGYLRRYNMRGVFDPDFNGGKNVEGFVLTPELGISGYITAIARHATNKLVLMGNNGHQGFLVGFTLDGASDTGLNNGDLLWATLPGLNEELAWVDCEGSGEGFFALGYTGLVNKKEMVLARYLSSGLLDTRFGAGKGWVTSSVSVEPRALIRQVISVDGQSRNRMLVTGVLNEGGNAVVLAFSDVVEV